MWDSAVDLVRLVIFTTAHFCAGSLGAAIVVVSLGVRLALLPWTLRLARQSRAQQKLLASLKPSLERLQQLHANDPATLFRETRALHREHGVKLMSSGAMFSAVVQLPLFGALLAAVRGGLGAKVAFAWIADLSRPDRVLVLAVASLAGIATSLGLPANTAPALASGMKWVSVILTLAFLWSASSAVALSLGAGSLVSALQGWLLSRDARREAALAAEG